MDSTRPRPRPSALGTASRAAWIAGLPLLSVFLAATLGAQAQGLPDTRSVLSARLRELRVASREAAAQACDSLARSIEASKDFDLKRRASALDELRNACAPKLSWTDPVLVRVAESLVEHRRALESEEPAPLCEALRALGYSYSYLSRPEEALRLFQEAVAIARRHLGRGTTGEDLARALEHLTSGLLDQRSFPEAMAAAAESLRLRRQAIPYRTDLVVTALTMRANVEVELDLKAAKATLLEAHVLSETLGPEHAGEAGRVANNLGEVLYHLGELPQAITFLQEAERLRSGGGPANGVGPSAEGGGQGQPDRRLASTQRTLGEVFYSAGDYPRAIEYFHRAVSGHLAWLGKDASRYCDTVTGLATVLEASGQWDEALTLQREALAIRETAVRSAPASRHGELQLSLARSLSRLGALQHRMGSAEAAASVEQALAIQDDVLTGAANADHAESLLELAEVRRDAGDLRSARELADRCLHELATLGEHGPLQLRAMELAARLAERAAAGLRTLEKAHQLASSLYGEASPWTASILQTRTELRLRQNDTRGALDDALLAQEISLPHVRAVVQAFPRDQALAFAANRRLSLDLALHLLAEHPGISADKVARVWQVALNSRMLVLNAEMDRQRLIQATADPLLAAEARRLAAARERFAHLLVRSEIVTAAHRSQLRDSRRELDDAEGALAAKLRHRLPGDAAGRVSLGELRRRLPGDAALVAFFLVRRPVGSDAYIAFVLRRGGPPRAVKLGGAADLDWLVERWRDAILGAASDAAMRKRTGQALRHAVWDPIVRCLGGTRIVFVVPDGAVHLVSLMALPTPSGRYLIEEGWAFHTLSSERDLLAKPAPQRPGPWLAVGGVDYDQASHKVALAATVPVAAVGGEEAAAFGGTRATYADLVRGGDCRGSGLPMFGALPGSREEIQELARLWQRLQMPKERARALLTVLTGQEATKQALQLAIRGKRLVHLATHGFALTRHCGPVRPAARGIGGLSLGAEASDGEIDRLAGLVLAGANDRSRTGRHDQDGILTETEILNLDLSAADWVVLSACDSGLGTIQAGEGVVGMLRAFQVAGARTVIVSLWSIDDREAHDWMRELYRARFERRLSTIEAVRQAALHSLQLSRTKGDDNPARWAGFVATGQWH
jgi:CHAT domain-containing protein/tetratricopeptide (TPR) repeat protein